MQNNTMSQLAGNKIQIGNKRISNLKYSLALILGLGLFNVNSTNIYVDEDNLDEILSRGAETDVHRVEIGSTELLDPHDFKRIADSFQAMRKLDLSSIDNISSFAFLRYSSNRLKEIIFSDMVARHYGVSAEALSKSLLISRKLPPIFPCLNTPGSSITKKAKERTGVSSRFMEYPPLERCLVVPKKRTDSRRMIETLSDVTHSAQGVVNFMGKNGGNRGSGTLIGRNLVLTAAHNVFDEENDEEFTCLDFTPGFDGKVALHGVKEVKKVFYPTAYSDGDHSEDYALLVLDENVGDYTGYLGLSVLSDDEFIGMELHVTGYPGAAEKKDLSYRLFTMSGKSDATLVKRGFVGYYIDTSAGQSGSAVWYRGSDGHEYVTAVHVRGGERWNEGTRLTRSRLL